MEERKKNKLLIILWFLLILSLFSFWINLHSRGGWFFPMPVPSFSYEWTWAWVISIVFFIIAMSLIFTFNNKLKAKIPLSIFILWILSWPIFYLLSPDFRFYHTPMIFQYANLDWKITNIDKYLKLVWKYCKMEPYFLDNWNFKGYQKPDYCWHQGKYKTEFDSVEDYIKVFDYARDNDMKKLYRLTFNSIEIEKFWYEKLIEKYKDKTFQAYLIVKRWISNDNIKLLKENIFDTDILFLLNYYEKISEEWMIILNKGGSYESQKYWINYDYEVYKNIQNLIWINHELFNNN